MHLRQNKCIDRYTYIYIHLTVKQAYHHKNDGRVEISDVYGSILFDHCRFRLLSHFVVLFNSTFLYFL